MCIFAKKMAQYVVRLYNIIIAYCLISYGLPVLPIIQRQYCSTQLLYMYMYLWLKTSRLSSTFKAPPPPPKLCPDALISELKFCALGIFSQKK